MRIEIGKRAVEVKRCKFRLKFYALRFGGAGGFGISYEIFGISLRSLCLGGAKGYG